MSDVITKVISPAPRAEWHRLVKVDETSNLTQSPEWTDAVTSFTSWRDASRLYETTDGHSFVLPLVEKGPGKAGRALASMPSGWGMGGFVGSRPLRAEDITAVMDDLNSLRYLGLRILPNPLRAEAWTSGLGAQTLTLPRHSHVLDLDGGFETVWNERFRQTARRNARKALKGDIEIERDTTGRLIPVYRDLLERSVERWAASSNEPLWLARMRAKRDDPPGKLEYLAETLQDQMVTFVAWHHGEAAAANILLTGNSAFYWRGAMHETIGSSTHAPYALQRACIEEACNAGARHYYLGESGTSSGMAHFKERFGGIGHDYPEVRSERVPLTKTSEATRGVVKRLIRYRSS
jgi:hypothetical protein